MIAIAPVFGYILTFRFIPEVFLVSAPLRILLVRTDRLGDVILTLPMLHVLRCCYPKAHLAMLLRRYTGEIVEGNPYLDQIIWYDDREEAVPFARLRAILRENKFDAAVVVHPTLRLAILMAAAGIRERVGSGYRWYSFLFNRKVFEHRKDAARHELEYNLRLLHEFGCEAPNVVPDFGIVIPPTAMEATRRVLSHAGINPDAKYVVIHPGSGGSARDWPLERFGRLAENLRVKTDVQVIIAAGIGEEEKANATARASAGTAVPIAGKLNLKELAALLKNAQLFVGNSSGPLHLAVAVGTPVIGLYPRDVAMSARRWGPYMGRGNVLTPVGPEEGGHQMEGISVEQVAQAAYALLADKTVNK